MADGQRQSLKPRRPSMKQIAGNYRVPVPFHRMTIKIQIPITNHEDLIKKSCVILNSFQDLMSP